MIVNDRIEFAIYYTPSKYLEKNSKGTENKGLALAYPFNEYLETLGLFIYIYISQMLHV